MISSSFSSFIIIPLFIIHLFSSFSQWHDHKLTWSPENFGNVSVLYVPASLICAESTYNVTISTKAALHYSGLVTWGPPALFKSTCPIEVEWFPFDIQTCHLKFGSWSYSEEALDLQHLDVNVSYSEENDTETGAISQIAEVERGIDLSEYYPSVEWDILKIPARRHGKTYPSCCPGSSAFIDITYYIHLRRKPLFYTVNLIFPCVGISFLTVVVFYLPSDTGEKISLSISILVSLTVFFLLLTEIIPSTSIVLPLICKYLLFTMVMVTLSVFITIVVLNVHFHRPATHEMPNWVRTLFLHFIPKWICMRRPRQWSHRIFINDRTTSLYASSPSTFSTTTLSTPILSPVPLCHKTCQARNVIGEENSSMIDDGGESTSVYANPRVVKTMNNLCSIAAMLQREKEDSGDEEDWKYVATVLDRLLLLIFAAACVIGTMIILLRAPSLYDYTQPIDTTQQ